MPLKRTILAVLAAALIAPAAATANTFPMWGNDTTGDCAFAAAANWELLHGQPPAEPEIVAEYEDALARNHGEEGTTGEELESYWRTHGIGGLRARLSNPDPEAIGRVVRRNGPVIAELAVTPMQRWGAVVDEAGGIHYVVVLRVNRRGPVIVTWGEAVQMTWWQWREDAFLLYVPHLL